MVCISELLSGLRLEQDRLGARPIRRNGRASSSRSARLRAQGQTAGPKVGRASSRPLEFGSKMSKLQGQAGSWLEACPTLGIDAEGNAWAREAPGGWLSAFKIDLSRQPIFSD